MFAIYLAALVPVIVAFSSVPANASVKGLPAVPGLVLLVVAPIHTDDGCGALGGPRVDAELAW